MKSTLMATSTGMLLFVAGAAHAQSTPQASQSAPQENNTATQVSEPSAGMEAYGGSPDTRSQTGAKNARPCRIDPQCNVFFGGS
jgi:hypothetical protein